MEQIIEIANHKIFTKIEGTGPPLLLLHSYWGSQLLFDQLAVACSDSHKVIRIDLPGHGESGTPPADYRFDTFAEVLLELLIHLKVKEKIAIIGHSMGGYVALAFAARYPERTESLVLMHSPVREADIQSIKLRNREAGLLIKGKRDLLLQVTIPSNFAPEPHSQANKLVALLNQTARQVTIDGALRSIEAMNYRTNYLPILLNSPYPILIIIGKHDKVYRAAGQLNDARKIPNAKVLVLNHSGHLGFLEEEEIVLTTLKAFQKNNFQLHASDFPDF